MTNVFRVRRVGGNDYSVNFLHLQEIYLRFAMSKTFHRKPTKLVALIHTLVEKHVWVQVHLNYL